MLHRFSRFEKLIGSTNLANLHEKCVLIVGCGGVGGYCAEALARSNIGKLILVDYDVVDVSNINRQIIATEEVVGQKKVLLLKNRINAINPECQVIIVDKFIDSTNLESLFEHKVDFFIDACDTISTKKAIIQSCLSKNVEFLTCLGTGNRLDPSKLEITTIDKTNYDPIARILRKFVRDNNIKNKITVLSSLEKPIKTNDRIPGSTAFVPSSAGLLIASYVVQKFLVL